MIEQRIRQQIMEEQSRREDKIRQLELEAEQRKALEEERRKKVASDMANKKLSEVNEAVAMLEKR